MTPSTVPPCPQANSYQASEVVATLKQQFLDDPTVTKMVFTSEDQASGVAPIV